MEEDATLPKVPAEVKVIVYGGSGIDCEKPIHAEIKLGNEKFGTTEELGPKPVWNTECVLPVKSSDGTLKISVKKKHDLIGAVKIPVSDIPNHERKIKTTRALEGNDGEIAFKCWVTKWTTEKEAGLFSRLLRSPSKRSHRRNLSDGRSPIRESKSPRKSKADLSRTFTSMLNIPDGDTGSPKSNLLSTKNFARSTPNVAILSPAPKSPTGPEVTGVSPQIGPCRGAYPITLRGSRLGTSVHDIISISIAGVECVHTLTYISPRLLKVIARPCTIDDHSGPIIITTESGGHGTSTVEFHFSGPAFSDFDSTKEPEVSGVSPRSGPTVGATPIKIRGNHLGHSREDVLSLHICGVDCTDTIQTVTPKLIECVAKPARGEGCIVVTTQDGATGISLVTYQFFTSQPPPATNQDLQNIHEMSQSKLKREITELRQANNELQHENQELKAYIDKCLLQLLEFDPSGAFLLKLNATPEDEKDTQASNHRDSQEDDSESD